jgi:CMP-N-acetylneuraminic acid synthetase
MQTQKLKEALESLKDIKSKAVASRVECENKI